MKYPTREECMAIMERYRMPKNIRAHCEGVEKVAVSLASGMKSNGVDVDVELVSAAALLHDIGKIYEIEAGGRAISHMVIGHKIVKRAGYPMVAGIVKKHILDDIMDPSFDSSGWERKLICYADKRVRHHEIVSLRERIDYLMGRYPKYAAKIACAIPKIEALEAEIIRLAGVSSDDILAKRN